MPAFFETLHPVDPGRDQVVVATRLTVRNPATALAVFRRLPAIRRQLRGTTGLARYGLQASLLRMRFTTFAVFDDRRALAAFLGDGAHGEAMRSLGGRFRSVEARTLGRRGDAIPTTWKAIHALLEDGPSRRETVAA